LYRGYVIGSLFDGAAVKLSRFWLAALLCCVVTSANAATPSFWTQSSINALKSADDDIGRNNNISGYFDGIEISQYRFSENGFAWHLIRYANAAKPVGPLWMVPHDDENAAFDAMIAAVRQYGGTGIAVNSGPGSLRRQAGNGRCGIRAVIVTSCDPNRNFDASTPLFTAAFLDQRGDAQPVLALHTNSPGFSGDGHGGRGEVTILDMGAYKRGEMVPREGGIFAVNPAKDMANHDTLGLTAYLSSDGQPEAQKEACGQAIANAGVHFWHERVGKSDGSMSNYLAINAPDIGYFNAESRSEIDLAAAAARHKVMIAAYLKGCLASRDEPTP
jgi:hypothetical protein